MQIRSKNVALLLVLAAVLLGMGPAASQPDCPPEPHPCGGEWPEGLEGPFELEQVKPVRVKVPLNWSDPGDDRRIELDGTLAFPDLPDGVRAPAILISTPYNGRCLVRPEPAWGCYRDPAGRDAISVVGETCPVTGYWADQPPDPACSGAIDHLINSLGIPPVDLVEQGYVVATFTIRGIGGSGGCFEFGGRNEQLDQKALVDWLAAQDWSNERVGMGGLSYVSWTTWQAAVQAPDALKTIVTAGVLVDVFQGFHTPQGALYGVPSAGWDAYFGSEWSLGTGELSGSYDWIGRACPESIASFSTRTALEYATEERDRAYYEERSLLGRMDDVRAAVLSAHGFTDLLVHAFQDSMLWDLLPQVPKRFIGGWWGHTFPSNFYEGAADRGGRDYEPLNPAWSEPEWRSILIRWLGYWLKGVGTPGRIDVIDSSATGPGGSLGDWVSSSHGWSNPEEVLYLASSSLKTAPGGDSASFRDAPIAASDGAVDSSFDSLYCGDRLRRAVYETAPLEQPAAIVGNPYAYLNLSSDMPGGIVDVTMFSVPPGFNCGSVGSGKVKVISMGAADLRHHDSPYVARDFPIDKPTHVRIDLTDLAMRVPRGHRIAIVVSRGEHTGVGGRWMKNGRAQDVPQITIHAGDAPTASQIVLPIAEGTLGGSAPTITYPPRPFMPA